ncbi:MAG: dual specificity protein phosphatase family protein [Myxococcota bacterium]
MIEHFTDLDDLLALGSHPHAPEHVQALHGVGVRAVVSLQSDRDLAERGLDWGILWGLYTRLGIAATRVPIRDFDRRDLRRRLDDAVEAVEEHVAGGRKTYVYCNAGLNRSPSVVIAWLMVHRGMSLDEAWARVTEHHHSIPYRDVLERWARKRRLPVT